MRVPGNFCGQNPDTLPDSGVKWGLAPFLHRLHLREARIVTDHLEGRRLMSPSLRNQKRWARHLSPDTPFDPRCSSWDLLQQFSRPLLESLGSPAHVNGLRLFGLDAPHPPQKEDFQNRVFKETGWRIVECKGEVPPMEYFDLLRQGIFPCVFQIRPLKEVLCGSKPDFWHEAAGHIAAFCDPKISWFYRQCGELVHNVHRKSGADASQLLMQVLWVLLEYGLLRVGPNVTAFGARVGSNVTAFGAALASSYMGLQRFQRGYYIGRKVEIDHIIQSRLYEEGARIPRDPLGRVQLYCIEDFDQTLKQLTQAFL